MVCERLKCSGGVSSRFSRIGFPLPISVKRSVSGAWFKYEARICRNPAWADTKTVRTRSLRNRFARSFSLGSSVLSSREGVGAGLQNQRSINFPGSGGEHVVQETSLKPSEVIRGSTGSNRMVRNDCIDPKTAYEETTVSWWPGTALITPRVSTIRRAWFAIQAQS